MKTYPGVEVRLHIFIPDILRQLLLQPFYVVHTDDVAMLALQLT